MVLGPEESARVSATMSEFHREVNAAAVDPQFIATVRKKLELDQKEAAAILGAG